MKHASVLFATLAIASACDSPDPTSSAQPTEAGAEIEDDEPDAADELEREQHSGRHGDPTDRLCEKLDCNDEQRAELDAVFERPDRGERPDDTAANQALAAAFRGDAFAAADVEAFINATRGKDDRMAEHVEKLASLHAILSAEQRATLADEMEHGFMGGRGRHDRKWEKKGDGAGGAKFVAHKVDKLCEPLACTADQKQKIAAIVGQAKAERPERGDDGRGDAIADAMRAETFDAAAVKEQLEAKKAKHDERHAAKADALVAIHGVLDATQRDKVADRIEIEGPEALLAKHGKHGKRKR